MSEFFYKEVAYMARRRLKSESGHPLDMSTLTRRFNAAYTSTVQALSWLDEVSEVNPLPASRYGGIKERSPDVRLDREKRQIHVILYSPSEKSKQRLIVYIQHDADWKKGVHAVCRVLGVSGKPLLADTNPDCCR